MKKIKIFRSKKNLTRKQVVRTRNILSFVLFICISICSTCIAGGVGLSNQDEIAASLLESSYINALTSDVKQYAEDLCDEQGLPKDVVKESISYNELYDLERSYVYTALIKTDEFNDKAFLANVLHIKDNVKNSLTKSLISNSVAIDEKTQASIDDFATDVSNYAKNRVRFENESLFQKILNNARIINYTLICVTVLIGALIILKLLSVGNKKYRSVRYIIHSFSGCAVYNLATIGVFNLFKQNSGYFIYPSYLQGAIDNYISACTYDFIVITMFVLFVSVCVAAIAWLMKRNDI